MALIQSLTTSFKVELMQALHDLTSGTGDVFNIALFRSNSLLVGTFGPSTTNYSDMGADEVVGAGYVAGGIALTNITPASGTSSAGSPVAYADFADAVFTGVTIVVSGALIYNTSSSNRAVMVLDFGGDKTSSGSDMTITFPFANANTAILRLVAPS